MPLVWFLAIVGACLLFIPPAIYASQGEVAWPYVMVAIIWPPTFVLLRRCRLALVGTRSRWSRRNVILTSTLALASILVGCLALLSIGLAVRYAMSPTTLRAIDRAATRQYVRVPARPGAAMQTYSVGDDSLPRVIYVHGSPGHAGVWVDFLLAPVEGHRAVAIDRPGFARSADCGSVPSFEDQAQAIAQLLVSRNGRWPILVGHSLGGPIVTRVAAQFPDKVGGLVILAGSMDPDLEEPGWYSDLTSMPGFSAKMPEIYQTSNDEIAAAKEQTQLLAPLLANIRCPVYVVHGDADRLVPVANVDFIRSRLTGAPQLEWKVVPGLDHSIMSRRPDEVRNAIAWVAARMVPSREP